jgi:hypothetical protein
VDDLAGKILAYFRDELGLGPGLPRSGPEKDLLTLPTSLGYWTPLGGPWGGALKGVACARAGLRLVPVSPLFSFAARPCRLALGLDLEYALGLNGPGLQSFVLHGLRLRLPVEAFMELGGGHSLGLGLGPLLQVDTMVQPRIHDSNLARTTISPGAFLSLSYRYALTRNASVGLSNDIEIASYSRPLISYSPTICLDFRLRQPSGEAGHD